ncbi:MAG: M15 family metallopeptidase [Treponema sp.]|jgi:hypothetical protein|nr:M15 family metallopeptidase [Treponema sp.]
MHRICAALLLLLLSVPAFTQNFGRTANGELALYALQKCFPDKASAVSFIENDWTITAGGETFFWAGGRLLPGNEKDNIDSYAPHFFGVYPEKPLLPSTYPPQYIEILRSRGSNESRLDRKDNHRAFQSILYGGLERREIEALLVRIDFLGEKVSVHRNIAGAVKRIDEEIRKWDGAKTFIASIKSIGGYNWREIAGTQRMSYHSWGLAIDIQPKRLGGKAIYWQWERARTHDWMLVPLESRWNPPDPVIKAFEQEGFIWGGKWPLYDNMHFEYRPELHEFTRLLAAVPDKDPAGDAANGIPRQDLHHIAPDFLLK